MTFFRTDEIRLLGLFYLHAAAESVFAVVWIYWIIYLLDKGFAYSVVGLALAVNGASMAVLEVPTGALADAFSRKLSVILGLIGFSIILMLIPFIETPITLIVVFGIWGLPIALESGAREAWVVDNLKAENREDLIKDFYVKEVSIRSIGSIAAAALSALIVQFSGMNALWYVYGFALLISVFILFLQKEHFQKKTAHSGNYFKEAGRNIYEGAKFAVRMRNVFYIIIACFFVSVGSELFLVCSKPFLEFMNVARGHIGYLSAIGGAICIGIPFLAKYLAATLKKENYYLSLHSLVFGLALALVVFVRTPLMAAFFFVIMSLRDKAFWPVLDPFFQQFLPSELRATIGSFRNMIIYVAIFVGDLFVAAFTDMIGPKMTLAIGGIIILPSIIFFARLKSASHTNENSC